MWRAILGLQRVVGGSVPWQMVVAAAVRHSIVANADNFFLLVHNARAH